MRIRRLARSAPALAAGLMLTLSGVRAEDPGRRELGAHQHGHGALNIAIEEGRVTLELEAPGSDIVGFEHEAKSDADKAAVESATARLKAPLTLFKFPDAAGCKVVEAKVDLDNDDDGDDGGDHKHDGKDAPPDHSHDHDHGPYATIDVEYELSCASPKAITGIGLDYFKIFPQARSLTVNVVTPRAQSSFEVSRDKPLLDLGGLM